MRRVWFRVGKSSFFSRSVSLHKKSPSHKVIACRIYAFEKKKKSCSLSNLHKRKAAKQKKKIDGLFKCANEADVQITQSSSIWNRAENTDG